MLQLIRQIVREALEPVLDIPKPKDHVFHRTRYGDKFFRMYFERDKMIMIAVKYIEKYGYIRTDEEDTSTFDRLIYAIQRDPNFMNVKEDTKFCKEFVDAVKEGRIPDTSAFTISKLKNSLLFDRVRMFEMPRILRAISVYKEQYDKGFSQAIETDTTLLLKNMKLVSIDNGVFVFVDPNKNYYRKHGRPPAIYMRTAIGSKVRLTDDPYDLFRGDMFSFNAKVSKNRTDSSGHVINIIKKIQPV